MGREKGGYASVLCFVYVVKLHKVSAFSWVLYLLQRLFFFLPRGTFTFFFLTEGAAVCMFFSLSHRGSQFYFVSLTEGRSLRVFLLF